MGSNYSKLKSMADELRHEQEQAEIDKPHHCPHCGQPLLERADGTLYCDFDGVIHLFEMDL